MTERSRRYKEYIQSEDWQAVRKRYFKSKLWKRQGKTCWCCAKEGKVDLHHKTCKSLGNENLNHLVAICRSCHDKAHDLVKVGNSLWIAAKRVRQVESKGRPWKQAVQIATNQKRSKERKKKKRQKEKQWFIGLNKQDAKLLKMELSLRRKGIKY